MPTLFEGHYMGHSRDPHVPGMVCWTHKKDGLPKYLSFVERDDPCKLAAHRMFEWEEARRYLAWAKALPGPVCPVVLLR